MQDYKNIVINIQSADADATPGDLAFVGRSQMLFEDDYRDSKEENVSRIIESSFRTRWKKSEVLNKGSARFGTDMLGSILDEIKDEESIESFVEIRKNSESSSIDVTSNIADLPPTAIQQLRNEF